MVPHWYAWPSCPCVLAVMLFHYIQLFYYFRKQLCLIYWTILSSILFLNEMKLCVQYIRHRALQGWEHVQWVLTRTSKGQHNAINLIRIPIRRTDSLLSRCLYESFLFCLTSDMTNKADENQIMSVHVNQVIESVIWPFTSNIYPVKMKSALFSS